MRSTGRAWAYLGVVLGGSVSVAANIAHSYVVNPNPPTLAVAVSVFWPTALFVTVEILARVAWPSGTRWVLLRFGGLLPVATVAAVVSYRHLSGLLAHYGEDPLTVAIGPLAVDGLMLVATGALVATGRTRQSAAVPDAMPAAVPGDVPAAEPVAVPVAVPEPPKIKPASSRPAVAARDGEELREAARQRYRESVATGRPLSGAALGRAYGMSERWGRDRVAEVRAELGKANGQVPVLAGMTERDE